MTTIRVHHERNYTVIDNSALQDSRLSFVARGIHHLLLSYPDGWEVQVKHLQEQTPKEGRDAIKKALTELKNFGYVVKAKIIHPKTGQVLKWQSVIRETASDSGNLTIKANDLEALQINQNTENPSCGSQNTEFQSTGNKINQKTANPQCGKSRRLESPPSGKSVPLISNKDLTSNQEESNYLRPQKRKSISLGFQVEVTGTIQGGSEFLEDRPWILQWHRINPKYAKGFLEYLLSIVGRNECYKGNATLGDMKNWLAVANNQTDKTLERLQKAYAYWEQYQESKQANPQSRQQNALSTLEAARRAAGYEA